jgi:hypothetical protein
MKNDDDLKSLRPRNDFQKLLCEMHNPPHRTRLMQTERRSGAGLGRDLLGGGTSPALRFFRTKAAFHGLRFIFRE